MEDFYAERQKLMNIIEQEKSSKEHQIDVRVIKQFVVSFFEKSATEEVKKQMLETLSSMLHFNQEDRLKVGLAQQNQQSKAEKSPQSKAAGQ